MQYNNISYPNPPMIAGVLFAVSWFILVDGFILMQREPIQSNRLTFLTVCPVLLGMLGFIVIIITSPLDVQKAKMAVHRSGGCSAVFGSKEMVFLFVGWCLCFISTFTALMVVGNDFLGETTREYSFPAFALVLQSCFIPMAASVLWSSKSNRAGADDLW
eukprot:Tbor_TRINITY_DN4953_c2_g5::TRINITY_DN4953_c2_g5_i1::g.9789::m.9789